MAVFSIQRCNPDEQIVLDVGEGMLRIYGLTSFSVPLNAVTLRYVEIGKYEGGELVVDSESFCGNVRLTLAEYIQADHYFKVINQYNHEVTLQ